MLSASKVCSVRVKLLSYDTVVAVRLNTSPRAPPLPAARSNSTLLIETVAKFEHTVCL